MAKQDWVVTLRFTETEGAPDALEPWYREHDLDALVRLALRQGERLRDLKLVSVAVRKEGDRYA